MTAEEHEMSEYEPTAQEVEALAVIIDVFRTDRTTRRAAREILRHYEPRKPALYPGKCLFGGCDKDAIVQRCNEHLLIHWELRTNEQRCRGRGRLDIADGLTASCPGCPRCQPKATPKSGGYDHGEAQEVAALKQGHGLPPSAEGETFETAATRSQAATLEAMTRPGLFVGSPMFYGDCARDDSLEPTELEQIEMARGPVAALAAEWTNRATPKSDAVGSESAAPVTTPERAPVRFEGTLGYGVLENYGECEACDMGNMQCLRTRWCCDECSHSRLSEVVAKSSPIHRLSPTQEDFGCGENASDESHLLVQLGVVAVQIRDLLLERKP